MSYKYKVRIVFFFEVSSDQGFFFRLQIVWVADLTVIFLGNQFFGFVKTDCRDLVDFWKLYLKNLKLLCVVFLKKCYCILKKSCFHCHDLFKAVDVSHLKVKAGIFV